MENIEDEAFSRTTPVVRRGEEFPIEEIDSAPDWNALAWERIQARDLKAVKTRTLTDSLASKSTHVLKSVLNVCVAEQQDEELQELIRAELKRRPEIMGSGTHQ